MNTLYGKKVLRVSLVPAYIKVTFYMLYLRRRRRILFRIYFELPYRRRRLNSS